MNDPESRAVTDQPRMSLAAFRDEGYLQEVNRQFFHPLGLALGVLVNEGAMYVYDGRDDLEGVMFQGFPSPVDVEKAAAVAAERAKRDPVRETALGWVVQPLDEA